MGQDVSTEKGKTGGVEASSHTSASVDFRKFAGVWYTETGEKLSIEEGTWKCRSLQDGDRSRSFNLRWNASRGVVLWGRSYFADPADSRSEGEVVWYKLRDKNQKFAKFVWSRSPTAASTSVCSEESPSGPVHSRQYLLKFRAAVGPEEAPKQAAVRAMPWSELGIEAPPLDLEEEQEEPRPKRIGKLPRFRKASFEVPSTFVPYVVGFPQPMLPQENWASFASAESQANTEAVLSALCLDSSASDMWGSEMDPMYWQSWWGGFEDQDWAAMTAAQQRRFGSTKVSPKDRAMYEIRKGDIENDKDLRTTVMVRNICKAITHSKLVDFLSQCGLQDRYCFLYLPSSRGHTQRPCGIAFIDFRSPRDILTLLKEMEAEAGSRISQSGGAAPLVASYARLQGLQQLSAHFGPSAALATADGEKGPQFLAPEEESSTEDSDTTKTKKTSGKALKAEAPVFVPGRGLVSTDSTPSLGTFATPTLSVATTPEIGASLAGLDAASSVESLTEQVRSQIEYYFSVSNLCQDVFLLSLMDDEGWVKISDIATFRRVRRAGLSLKEIAASVANSEVVELCSEWLTIRSRDEERRKSFGYLAALPAPVLQAPDFMAEFVDLPFNELVGIGEGGHCYEDALAEARLAAAAHAAWMGGSSFVPAH
mmetsp:Transcript_140854/g.450322  ORF Transcript_140854/g.450322 Transcript_140854/m.450322 type:complete len:652 (+) Transcript_140854:71-2026(+)